MQTSHDGGDSTSVTSGVENEIKKSAMKPKKSSLKSKVPSFSQESDDTVNEPLLHKDKDRSEAHSAKYCAIGKTESIKNKDADNSVKSTVTTFGFCGTTESLLSYKDSEIMKTTSSIVAPLHNYMNTNVFNTHENSIINVTTKSQILVEIDSSSQSSYSPSPLIFTTAKIHTDANTKQMEPVDVTPVPILSAIVVSVSKEGNITSNEKKISNGSSVVSPVYTPMPISKRKEEKNSINDFSTVFSPTSSKDVFAKPIAVTSAVKLENNSTTVHISPTTYSSITAYSSSIKSNAKDKEGERLPVSDSNTKYLTSANDSLGTSNFQTSTLSSDTVSPSCSIASTQKTTNTVSIESPITTSINVHKMSVAPTILPSHMAVPRYSANNRAIILPPTEQETTFTFPSLDEIKATGPIKGKQSPSVTSTTKVATSITTTLPNATSAETSINKRAITTINANHTSKTSSTKPSAVITSPKLMTTNIQSRNNKTSQIPGTSKPPATTSIPKTESAAILSNTSTETTSNISITSAIKSPQVTATSMTISKDPAALAKKPAFTKTPSFTKMTNFSTPANKSTGSSTKITTTEDISVPASSAKKPNAMPLAKMSSVTTSTKTPSVSTTTKALGITPMSSSTKPITTNVSSKQTSAKVGKAGSAVPSFTHAIRPSESIKEGESKSSQNNKDRTSKHK